jgi:superfamily II DNA helicase RecQ
MANDNDEFDEFGLSSGDEADMLALADGFEPRKTKRRSSNDSGRPCKRSAIQSRSYPSALQAFTKNLKMQAFRLKQEQVILRILDGESAVVVFPIGGGKSLCYQVPALVFAAEDKIADIRGEQNGGITLVVSPLISLVKGQVDALVRKGIKAATMNSSKSKEKYLASCDLLRNGELKLLYCAPERLNNEGFIEQMKCVRGGIRLLAVDEAHCTVAFDTIAYGSSGLRH